jgi:hypothetical protein
MQLKRIGTIGYEVFNLIAQHYRSSDSRVSATVKIFAIRRRTQKPFDLEQVRIYFLSAG